MPPVVSGFGDADPTASLVNGSAAGAEGDSALFPGDAEGSFLAAVSIAAGGDIIVDQGE